MSVECICADGLSIPPLNIFTGENSVRQCIPSTFDNDSQWIFSNTSKGWIRVQHGLEWVQKCFEPSTRDKANGQFRLLICDGHDSHCSPQFLSHCAEHRILVLALVPHSSHLTQPLNVTVFGPLKRIVSGIINPMFQLGITRIQKSELIEAYSKAHMKAFSVKAGFSSTSIYPFNPNKVFNRIQSILLASDVLPLFTAPMPPTLHSQIPTSTTDNTPFTSQILTSSPLDFSLFQVANSPWATERNHCQPPARQYIRCVTSAAEKLFTRSSTLQQRTETQEALLAARKQRTSGKRSIKA